MMTYDNTMEGGEATPLQDGGYSVEAQRRRNHNKHSSSDIVRVWMVVGTTMGVLVLMLAGYSTMRMMDRSRTVPDGSQSLLKQLSEDSEAASSGQKCCETPFNAPCMMFVAKLCCPNKDGFDVLCSFWVIFASGRTEIECATTGIYVPFPTEKKELIRIILRIRLNRWI